MAPTETAVQELLDARAIETLRYRYCQHVDRHEYREWADLFAPDGTFTSDLPDRDVYTGPDEIYQFAREVLDDPDAPNAGYLYSTHVAVNPVVEVTGDEATGQWYFFLRYALASGTSGFKHGHYDETYRRVEDEWKFASVRVGFDSAGTFEPV